MQAIFETLFDIVYLVTVITLGILMIRNSRGEKQYLLYLSFAINFTKNSSDRQKCLCLQGFLEK